MPSPQALLLCVTEPKPSEIPGFGAGQHQPQPFLRCEKVTLKGTQKSVSPDSKVGHASFQCVASKEVKNFILKFMHNRATCKGASINLRMNYNPGEGVKNKLTQLD